MAKNREHRADYTLEEMLQLTGLDRKKFVDTLDRVCEMYDLPISTFKTDETKQKSNYLFPMEVAEPLALLIRNHSTHPLKRRNADPSKLSATAIAGYNRAMIEDIDKLSPYFKDVIYSLDGHLVSQQISEWTTRLVHEFTQFLYNLATIKSENVGAALKMFTKELNKMNYNLYRGSYIMNYAKKQNEKFAEEVIGAQDEEPTESAKILQQQNVSIDRLVAEVIKSELDIAYRLRTEDFLSAEDLLAQELSLLRVCGYGVNVSSNDNDCGKLLSPQDVKDLSDDDLRQIYYGVMLKETINQSRLEANKQAIEVIRNAVNWQPIEQKIRKGIFMDPAEIRLQSESIESESVSGCDEKKMDSESEALAKELFEGLKTGYVEHSQKVDLETETLTEIVDQFVGRALNEFLNRS